MPSAVPKPGESLADLFPEVAEEWHPTRNGTVTPFNVRKSSRKKVWWKCDAAGDHEWEAIPESRTRLGTGCPFCAGQRVSISNSLQKLFPEVAGQWHPTRNGRDIPSGVTAGTGRAVWWLCPAANDHEWQAPVSRRTRSGRGCPFCAGQRVCLSNSLAAVRPDLAAEWHPTKNGELTPSMIVPFTERKVWWKCPAGPDHEWEMAPHVRKGCPFCRGRRSSETNSIAVTEPEWAMEWHPTKNGALTPSEVARGSTRNVWWKCSKGPDHEWRSSPSSRRGCPFCAGQKVSETNSLLTIAPDVAQEWHPNKNGPLESSDLVAKSNKKVWWKCPKADDHEWQARPAARIGKGTGCPFCHGLRASSTNNLESLRPDVAAEWHPTRNQPLTPDQVVVASNKQFWWKCPEADDHQWQAYVNNRTSRDSGCPMCAGRLASVTNSVASLFPALAREWHPSKNGDLTPDQVSATSHRRVWWKCPKGPDHEWPSECRTRTGDGHGDGGYGCPYCDGKRVSVANNLVALFPEVTATWHPTKNGDVIPEQVVAGANKRFWWICDQGPDHEWETSANKRTYGQQGCPCCAHQKLSTTNCLATVAPDVAALWHPIRNDGVTPEQIIAGTNKRFWWQCDIVSAHEWRTGANNLVVAGTRCPHCTLVPRSAQEMRLAHELAALIDFDLKAHKVRFAGRVRDVDIVFEDLSVVVEFDGSYWHRNKPDKDRDKTQLIEDAGWRVIRVRERPLESIHVNDVMVDTLAPAKTVADAVLAKIVEVTGAEIPRLDEYLASDDPWREAEALTAIRAYLEEREAKKRERKAARLISRL